MFTTSITIVILIKHKLIFIIYNIKRKYIYIFPMETVSDIGSSINNILRSVVGNHKAKKISKKLKY